MHIFDDVIKNLQKLKVMLQATNFSAKKASSLIPKMLNCQKIYSKVIKS